MRVGSPSHAVMDAGDSRVPTSLCATCGVQPHETGHTSAGQQVGRDGQRPLSPYVGAALNTSSQQNSTHGCYELSKGGKIRLRCSFLTSLSSYCPT